MMANAIGEVMSDRNLDAPENATTLKENLNELLSIEGVSQGGSESSTVDNLFAVGDVKTTMRDSLGEKWLECNGDVLDKNDYEYLYNSNPNNPYFNYINYMPYVTPNLPSDLIVTGLNSSYTLETGSFVNVQDVCEYGTNGICVATLWDLTINTSSSSTKTYISIILFYNTNKNTATNDLNTYNHVRRPIFLTDFNNSVTNNYNCFKIRNVNNNFVGFGCRKLNSSSSTNQGLAGHLYYLSGTTLSSTSSFNSTAGYIYDGSTQETYNQSTFVFDILYNNSKYIILLGKTSYNYNDYYTDLAVLHFTSLSSANTYGIVINGSGRNSSGFGQLIKYSNTITGILFFGSPRSGGNAWLLFHSADTTSVSDTWNARYNDAAGFIYQIDNFNSSDDGYKYFIKYDRETSSVGNRNSVRFQVIRTNGNVLQILINGSFVNISNSNYTITTEITDTDSIRMFLRNNKIYAYLVTDSADNVYVYENGVYEFNSWSDFQTNVDNKSSLKYGGNYYTTTSQYNSMHDIVLDTYAKSYTNGGITYLDDNIKIPDLTNRQGFKSFIKIKS